MVEPQLQEVLKEEININFFIQVVEVQGKYTEYYKLYAKVKAKDGSEVDFTYLSPEEVEFRKILEKIEKLYKVYKDSSNEKLTEGAKEEILKLITLLIWNINR